jgi:HAD superfamily phosphatase (TIGR01668 family)
MWEKLFPDHYYDSIFEIPYKELKEKNIQALIFDIDNTLAPYNIRRPPEKTSNLLNRLQKMGFKVCLLTNNRKGRLKSFNEFLQLPAYHRSFKPMGSKARKAMKVMGVTPESTALIGDQVLTDIWCGNRLKVKTILVKPISKKDFVTVRMKRGVEKSILKAYKKKLALTEADK